MMKMIFFDMLFKSLFRDFYKEDSLKSRQIEVTASIEYTSLLLKPSIDNLGFDIWIKQ